MKQVTNQNSRDLSLINCIIRESQAINAHAEQMKAEGYKGESLKEVLIRNRETLLLTTLFIKEATAGNAKIQAELAGLPDDVKAELEQISKR